MFARIYHASTSTRNIGGTALLLILIRYNGDMQKTVRTVTVRIQNLFSKKSAPEVSHQDKLRQSARATLKKYHTTFRKLAQE